MGKVRNEEKIKSVKQDDFFSKPAVQGITHQFINDREVLEILDYGINDKNDVVEYPDEGSPLYKVKLLNNWSSDTNK